METWLVFHRGTNLPDFAAFPLLDDPACRELLAEYFRDHLRIAAAAGTGVVLETPTWRANADWGAGLGYDAVELDRVNRDAVAFLRSIAEDHPEVAVVVSGNIGPRRRRARWQGATERSAVTSLPDCTPRQIGISVGART